MCDVARTTSAALEPTASGVSSRFPSPTTSILSGVHPIASQMRHNPFATSFFASSTSSQSRSQILGRVSVSYTPIGRPMLLAASCDVIRIRSQLPILALSRRSSTPATFGFTCRLSAARSLVSPRNSFFTTYFSIIPVRLPSCYY